MEDTAVSPDEFSNFSGWHVFFESSLFLFFSCFHEFIRTPTFFTLLSQSDPIVPLTAMLTSLFHSKH